MPLEKRLLFTGVTIYVLIVSLLLFVLLSISADILLSLTVLTFIGVPLAIFLNKTYQSVIEPFYRLTTQVEAIRLEDYSLRMKSHNSGGVADDLIHEISLLSDELQARKSRYDQHMFLIFKLIEQLDAPIAVFDKEQRLSHANDAFSKWSRLPWKMLKGISSSQLGLEKTNSGWQLSEDKLAQHWQVKHSQFQQSDGCYHLVILSNIEREMSQAQQLAWKRVIRVLSHEIRNSMAPIKSLAQSLLDMEASDSAQSKALTVIVDRSTNLQDFVDRYAKASQDISINPTWVDVSKIAEQIKSLFSPSNIVIDMSLDRLWVDESLFEQVLINLIKNALEASVEDARLDVSFSIQNGLQTVEVADQGKGIANVENLFVPYYTTKADGHGIGLSFCKNVVEAHGGRISLENRQQGGGALARIDLPVGGH